MPYAPAVSPATMNSAIAAPPKTSKSSVKNAFT
jgi:hypothetical protein